METTTALEQPKKRRFYKGAVVTDAERSRARELRAQGMTLETIAAEMGRVKSTIYRIVKGGR